MCPIRSQPCRAPSIPSNCTAAIEELPIEFREAVVLKDLQGMSYREIAEIASVPIGTVMSRCRAAGNGWR